MTYYKSDNESHHRKNPLEHWRTPFKSLIKFGKICIFTAPPMDKNFRMCPQFVLQTNAKLIN